jgi:glycosyltransferase involved in cell wall biosynthesis
VTTWLDITFQLVSPQTNLGPGHPLPSGEEPGPSFRPIGTAAVDQNQRVESRMIQYAPIMATSETAPETETVPVADGFQPTVSIVIPAFNESHRIRESLQKVCEFVQRSPFSSEVIVVDDGSADDTAEIVRQFECSGIRLLQNVQNRGKGFSIRYGVLNARSTYVLFTDADLSAPIDELQKLYDVAVREQADIVIGSRAVDRRYIEKHQSIFREFGGIVFNRMVRLLLGLNIQDTQCGFKLFHRDNTRWIFEKQTTDGFGFDPEILFLGARRGLRIREVPVRWSHAEGTKVRFLQDGIRMFSDLVRIRCNYTLGRYS